MPYIAPEVITEAKRMDLLTYYSISDINPIINYKLLCVPYIGLSSL